MKGLHLKMDKNVATGLIIGVQPLYEVSLRFFLPPWHLFWSGRLESSKGYFVIVEMTKTNVSMWARIMRTISMLLFSKKLILNVVVLKYILLRRNFIQPYTGFLLREGTGGRPSNFEAAQLLCWGWWNGLNECLLVLKNLWNKLAYLVPLVFPSFRTILTQMYGGLSVNFGVH